MFTQRSALLGFVAFCFYLIAVVNQLSSFYYALTWLSTTMLSASLGVALLSLLGLKCQLDLTRSRGAAPLGEDKGSGALIAVSLANSGTLNKTNVVLEVRLIDAKNAVQSLRFLIEALPSGAAIESVLPLSGLARGKYQVQNARLIGSDVLGLFRTQRRVALEESSGREIIVGPPVLKGIASIQGGGNGFLWGLQRALVAQHSDELRGTRPYAPGDDLRHVHWKSSARAGELVVKEWEQTGQSSALILWDGAAQSDWGAGEWNAGEWGLILSASLCHALLSTGIPCDFARLDGAPLLVEARTLEGGELPTVLTDALSGAQANRTLSFERALGVLPRLSSQPSSRAVLVSSSLADDLLRGVSALRARGVQVQVILIDAASVAARAGDRRFKMGARAAKSSKMPVQGEGANAVAVTTQNYGAQANKLRQIGAQVALINASEAASADSILRAAVRAVAEPSRSVSSDD